MLLALLLVFTPAHAKDLRSRLGLGLHQELGSPVSTLSVKYGFPTQKPTINLQVEANVGVAMSAVTDLQFYAGGRLLAGVVAEDNLNVYLAAGAGYGVDGPSGVIRLQPAVGAEFFLFGLENLGLAVEWGVSVDLGADWAVRTAPNLAAHYYF